MSRENVKIVRAWIDGYNRRDMERLVELTDPEFEFRSIFVGIESIFRGYGSYRPTSGSSTTATRPSRL